MKNVSTLSTCFLLLFALTCSKSVQKSFLSINEKRVCDSLKIDTSLILQIKNYAASPVEPFHYSLGRVFKNGVEQEVDPIRLAGLVFKATAPNADAIINKYHSPFKAKGYSLFVLERNFGIKNKPDMMAVLTTTDKYEVLKQIQTDGINYNITNDSLLKVIRVFDDKYSLDLIGAGGDWCEFIITKPPADWMQMAKEAYGVCPDIVDQGAGSVEDLTKELQRTNRLYFWWD